MKMTTKDYIEESHNMLMSASSFSTLKRTLLKNIGSDKTRSFFFKFGYDIGITAAIAKANQKEEDLVNQRGTKSMHAMYGQVRDVIINPEFEKLLNGELSKINGKWIDSFEANTHLKYFSQADECVCYTLCGYVNGFLWHKFKAPLVTIETKCKAKGNECCEFEIRLEEKWMPEHQEIINIYYDSAQENEVDMTYDALLTHKDLIDKISSFYSMLTQSVTERHSMDKILQTAFEHLNIPILIEDLHGEVILQIGLNDKQLTQLTKERNSLTYTHSLIDTKYYEGTTVNKLMIPVLINKKPYANCSFIYSNGQYLNDNDHLFLERLANVIALCFLHEEALYEEQDRLSHTILDRLSREQYISLKEIEPYFKQYPFKVKPPYHAVSLAITSKNPNLSVDLHEIIHYFSKYAKQDKFPAVFSIFDDEIIFLIVDQKTDFVQNLSLIIKKIKKRHPKFDYIFGISTIFEDLTSFKTALNEAHLAQKFPNKRKITHYSDLGILGKFVSSLTTNQLHEIAKDMLHELYDFKDSRKNEMLYTLYRYLVNGQKLKETMADLTLSMGGLQYRIRQIETMLSKSLKDASYTSYLLLIIEALLLSDELNFSAYD